jgi:hypothetical protein
MEVTITHYTTHDMETSKPFVIYHILCKYKDKEWIVQRRYSEFHALHKSLSKFFDQNTIGKFPSKLLFGNFKQENLAKRKMQLQMYLDRIISNDATVDYPDVVDFLNFKQNVGEKIKSTAVRNVTNVEVTALYDYKAQDDTELSYKKDDTIIITGQDSNGWWYGYLKKDPTKSCGFVASNYVQQKPQTYCKAIYDYEADGEGELTINQNDLLLIIEHDQDKEGWTLVKKLGNSDSIGWVPSDFIQSTNNNNS